jgi:hypothetical protein
MSRNFSVIVEPHRWQRSSDELARLLEPVTGVSSPVLVSLLLRGPITVEADLSHLGAQNLVKRLTQMGIPAAIANADQPTIDEPKTIITAPNRLKTSDPDLDHALHAMGIIDIEISDDLDVAGHFAGLAGPSTGPRVPAPKIALSASTAATSPVKTNLNRLPAPSRSALLDMGPATLPSGGWGALFPDLNDGPQTVEMPLDNTVILPPNKPVPTKSLFDDDDDDDAPMRMPGEPVVSGELEKPFRDSIPDAVVAPEIKPAVAPQPAIAPFEPSKAEPIVEAFKAREDRAPYAPTGFDDRTPHMPNLARTLSIIAPGAGQIYNGDDDQAMDFGLGFWKIKPWINSAKEAHRRAEKVRDFWLPWPKPGALFRAMRYATGFWFVILAVVGIVGFVVSTAADRRVPKDAGPTENDWMIVIQDANSRVVSARIAALDAMAEAADESRDSEFIMDDTERAARVFTVGFGYCQKDDFRRCEELMKRAYSLNRAERRALRLQAWASVQARTPDGSKMPDVGEVESLGEFEMELFRKEQEKGANP